MNTECPACHKKFASNIGLGMHWSYVHNSAMKEKIRRGLDRFWAEYYAKKKAQNA